MRTPKAGRPARRRGLDRIGWLWLLAAVAAGGCAWAESLRGADLGWEVVVAAQRGSYLDATLRSADQELRFYFRNDDTCRELLAQGSRVEYLALGRLGRVRRGGEACEPIGVASLRAWMSRRPRPRVEQKPRASAAYRQVYEDSEVWLARGEFPLAALAGWPGTKDLVAVMPRSEECRAVLDKGAASMEYGQMGLEPFWLLIEGRRCPIAGFAKPLPAAADR